MLTLRSVYMGESKHCSLGILVMTTDREKELEGNTPKLPRNTPKNHDLFWTIDSGHFSFFYFDGFLYWHILLS